MNFTLKDTRNINLFIKKDYKLLKLKCWWFIKMMITLFIENGEKA